MNKVGLERPIPLWGLAMILLNHFYHQVNKKHISIVDHIDLAKAFNSKNHDILITKLENIGVHNNF